MRSDWLSMRVTCEPSQQIGALTAAAGVLDGARGRGHALQWLFQRKEPGIVLRVLPAAAYALEVLSELERGLHDATQGRVPPLSLETYEPEVGRFGGGWGVGLFHEDADRDSRGAIAGPPALGVASAWDLIRQCTDDRAEEWETWLSVASSFRGTPRRENPELMAASWQILTHSAPVPDEWDPMSSGNSLTARRMTTLRSLSLLQVGVRSWLASAVLFRLNRWGLGMDAGAVARSIVENGRAQ